MLYLPIFRTQPAGSSFQPHDITILRSDDGGATWKNPYTYYNGGAAQANGDAPKCDAPDAASACANTAYLASTHSSVMWKAGPSTLVTWTPIMYGQDGSMPTGITDGCDPATYVCFTGGEAEGTLARVPVGSIQEISAWQYYTCPTITDSTVCPGGDPASWSSNITDRTQVMPRGNYSFFTTTYLKDFHTYVHAGYYVYPDTRASATVFLTAPTAQGPWTVVGRIP